MTNVCDTPIRQLPAAAIHKVNHGASPTYGRIVMSTALMGGAAVANAVLGVIRTKAFAVLLGPAGVGLIGVYMSISHFVSMLAGMGIHRSGVRQIAEAVGSGDQAHVVVTAGALRKCTLLLGMMGGLVLAVLSLPISRATFGSGDQWMAMAILGIAVCCTIIANGHTALVQGYRRLGDLVRIGVLGSLWGTIIGIPIICIWGEQGVVPMLVALAITGVITSWYYARRITLDDSDVDSTSIHGATRSLLKLGVAFMASGVVAAGAVYLIRTMIVRQFGLEAAGHYTAAFILAGIYAGFILRAMGSDFYPRLTAVAGNPEECTRLVNEQTEVGLLIAVPGILATLCLAPWVIQLFYTDQFGPAVGILRWQVLGVLGQVTSWPMGFILLAMGKGRLFFLSELTANSLHLLLVWLLIRNFGILGAGMAFFGVYLFYWCFIFILVRRISKFSWSIVNRKLIFGLVSTVSVVFLIGEFLPLMTATVLGLLITVAVSAYAIIALMKRMELKSMADCLIFVRGGHRDSTRGMP